MLRILEIDAGAIFIMHEVKRLICSRMGLCHPFGGL